MTEPIYIVSGFPRSGTSMMMRALQAGGLPCVYSTKGDDERNRNARKPGYIPNPHGFFENADLSPQAWTNYRGKAVKVVRDNLYLLPDLPMRVVYMRRDPVEIQASHDATEDGCDLRDYFAKVADDVKRTGAVVLDYADVVTDPLECLLSLNWPINAVAAAATIDPALYRHRGAVWQ